MNKLTFLGIAVLGCLMVGLTLVHQAPPACRADAEGTGAQDYPAWRVRLGMVEQGNPDNRNPDPLA
jgi:hypothetical protein